MKILNFFRKVLGNREIAKTPKRSLTWGRVQQHRALTQGWGLFEIDRAGGRITELQFSQEKRFFRNDQEAWLFVHNQMMCGDPLAIQAFDYLEEHSPGEYEAIFRYCSLIGMAA